MIKTIRRIRLPEVNSSTREHRGRCYPRISPILSIDCNGVLRSASMGRPPIPHLRWQRDAIIGKPIATWEFGEEPDSHLTNISILLRYATTSQFKE